MLIYHFERKKKKKILFLPIAFNTLNVGTDSVAKIPLLVRGEIICQTATGSGPEMSLQAYWQSLLPSTSFLFSVFPISVQEEMKS